MNVTLQEYVSLSKAVLILKDHIPVSIRLAQLDMLESTEVVLVGRYRHWSIYWSLMSSLCSNRAMGV